ALAEAPARRRAQALVADLPRSASHSVSKRGAHPRSRVAGARRDRGLSTLPRMEPRVEASLSAYDEPDDVFVDRAFALVLRRPPDAEAGERAVTRLGDGTLSRATFLRELTTAEEFGRVCELDDAVEAGLGARRRGERLRWLSAPPGTDERVIEIPWVLS